MTDLELGWVAGFLEGEGSFVLRDNCRPRIQARLTDLDVLEKLQAITGGRIYTSPPRKAHYKDAWIWVIGVADEAVVLMQRILPLMGTRRAVQINHCLVVYKQHRELMDSQKEQRAAKRGWVRELHATNNYTHQQIADMVNLERSTVTYIINGRFI